VLVNEEENNEGFVMNGEPQSQIEGENNAVADRYHKMSSSRNSANWALPRSVWL